MAKSNHLSWLLLLTVICIYSGITGYSVKNSKGPEQIDYRPGPAGSSLNKIAVSDRSDIIAKVQQIYNSQIGVRESGPNSGPAVEKYLHYVNLPKGNPWCAAFVCWVYGQAGVANPRTAWSPALFPASNLIWSRKSGLSKTVQAYPLKPATEYSHSDNDREISPATADVFGIYFPEKGRIAHVGFIDQWDGNWLISVEGNTNESGNPEGDGVYRKRRPIRSIYRVARYIN